MCFGDSNYDLQMQLIPFYHDLPGIVHGIHIAKIED